ncbi:hemerythrin domain-containing protein [Burkholderia sp. LMU1-1-1.1]|uniref:hemerythrin domain-containing protein n=1 Tax=Burkholderia sp. LMU1-1-1.1 TaxID=3135266 RepID=UPI003448084F
MFTLSKLSPSITDMIRMDHSHVLLAFHQYTGGASKRVKKALTTHICTALEIHAMLEEEYFYPTMRRISPDPVVAKSEPEHDEMRLLIARLRASTTIDEQHDQLLMELMRIVLHHVADEETVLLAAAEKLLSADELSKMGVEMSKRRLQLVGGKAGTIAASGVVGFSGSTTALVLALAGGIAAAHYLKGAADARRLN